MSSILKALKKLEREKSLQRDDHIDLARDIFRGSERRRGPDWLTIILAGAVVLTVVAVTLVVLRLMERREMVSGVPSQSPASRAVLAPSVPENDAGVVEELVDQRRPQVRAPAAVQRPVPTRRTPIEVAAIPVKGPEALVVEEVLSPPARVPVAPSPQPVSPQIAPAPEGLALTAIVFQAEREARIAVINELPVMEGSHVGDYMIMEIQADRVILSRSGAFFELLAP